MIELRALMHEQLAIEARIQTVIDGLVPPTTTGYLHREQSWTVAWVRAGEYSVELKLGLDPPEGAHEWKYPTIERLQTLQRQLGADGVYAVPMDGGKTRYVIDYKRKDAS